MCGLSVAWSLIFSPAGAYLPAVEDVQSVILSGGNICLETVSARIVLRGTLAETFPDWLRALEFRNERKRLMDP
jgi:hypothetical protein